MIGWGATCRRHTNSWEPHIVCKRQLAFGGLSEAECRTRMKMWLLAGMDIPEGEDDGRQQHFAILPRDVLLPLLTDEYMDREADRIALELEAA